MSSSTSVDSSGYLSNLVVANTIVAPIAAIGMINLVPTDPATINNGKLGSLIYNTTTDQLNYWNGKKWTIVASS